MDKDTIQITSDSDIEITGNTTPNKPQPSNTTPQSKKKGQDKSETREMIDKLLERADNIEDIRKKMSDATDNRSPHQKKVDKFVDYLKTNLMEIPQRAWFNFTVECMELIEKYTADDMEQLPPFPSGYASGNSSSYHTNQGATGGANYGYSHGHVGGSYSKRSSCAVTPRHFGSSHMYGGSTVTNPRNEAIQAATGYQASQSISTTPISPPLVPSGNVGQASTSYAGSSGNMYSQLTAPIAGKSITSSNQAGSVASRNNESDDLPGFNEGLFDNA